MKRINLRICVFAMFSFLFSFGLAQSLDSIPIPYYNIEGSDWIKGNNDIQTLLASGSVDNTAIIAAFDTGLKDISGNAIGHFVILQSYNAANDTYTYYDPSFSGTEEEKIKTVSGSQMLFAARAGCK